MPGVFGLHYWRARYVAAMSCAWRYALLHCLYCTYRDRIRDRDTEGFGGLVVDHQLERRWLFDWQVGRLGTLQDTVHIRGGAPIGVRIVGSICHEPAGVGEFSGTGHSRNAMPGSESCNLARMRVEDRIAEDDKGVSLLLCYRGKGTLQIVGRLRRDKLKPNIQVHGGSLRLVHLLLLKDGIGRIPKGRHHGRLGKQLPEHL